MRTFYKFVKYIIVCCLISLIGFVSCTEDNPVEPVPPTNAEIIVRSANDSSGIANANVVLYNANTGESISRVFSGNDGVAKYENMSSGNYYVRISEHVL